jgi:hypothetical protein
MLEFHLCESNVGYASIITLFLKFYQYADVGIDFVNYTTKITARPRN